MDSNTYLSSFIFFKDDEFSGYNFFHDLLELLITIIVIISPLLGLRVVITPEFVKDFYHCQYGF